VLGRTRRVVAQTRSRLAAVMPDSSSRLVSLHDADARPIRKGRLGKPVEFGYKAQIVDNADGVIPDHSVELGNPPDTAQLALAIERIIRRTGRRPRAVTADRGYGDSSVERELDSLGVASVAIRAGVNPARPDGSSSAGAPSGKRSNGARIGSPNRPPQIRSISGFCMKVSGSTWGRSGLVNPMISSPS